MNQGQEIGKQIAETRFIRCKNGIWLVPSSDGRPLYEVRLSGTNSTCSCPDCAAHGNKCKHIVAAEYKINQKKHASRIHKSTKAPAIQMERVKNSPRNWRIINKAQTNEPSVVMDLLADLCNGIQPLAEQKMGRPSIPLSDMVLCMVYKVYMSEAARRIPGLINGSKNVDRYVRSVPAPSSVHKK